MNKFKANVLIFCSLLSYAGLAQTKETIFLWTNDVPGEIEEKNSARQTDNVSGNVIRLTDVTNPCLTVYRPEKQNDSGAAIIICPGGGYNILAIDKEGSEVAEWVNSLGYTAFVLQYRVPKKRNGAFKDIQRAVRILRTKSELYDFNPNKIGVLGFSAGGHLSARAATDFNTNSYVKIDEIDEASARPDFSILIYPAYLDKGEDRKISPELPITKETPPFFIFGTTDDSHGNSSLVMASALRDKNIPVEIHMLPKGGHGYGLRKGNVAAETWPVLTEIWLKHLFLNTASKNEK